MRARRSTPVGCTARVEQIDTLEDGRFEIITVGHTRFRLLDIDATAGTPYLTGVVQRLGEPDGDGAPVLARSVARALRRLPRPARRLPAPTDPSDPRMLSYIVAAAVRLDLVDRQRLLEQPDHRRPAAAPKPALLRRETALVSALQAVPATELTPAQAPFGLD